MQIEIRIDGEPVGGKEKAEQGPAAIENYITQHCNAARANAARRVLRAIAAAVATGLISREYGDEIAVRIQQEARR